MIVVETLLREIFSQIPDISYAGKMYPVKFHWGNQDDLNLYMKTEYGNPTPLIWLVEAEDGCNDNAHSLERRIALRVAKSSEHKTDRNPIVWDSEFSQVLNPLLDKVIQCLNKSGVTTIVGGEYRKRLRANYSEYERTTEGKTKSETLTIDHWNVIYFEATVRFLEKANGEPLCINEIYFKTT